VAERQLDIVLKVKDLASNGFKQAAQSARAMSQQLTDTERGGMKAASSSLESLAKFGQVAAAIGIAAKSAESAIQGIDAAWEYFSGDIDKAGEKLAKFEASMERLPFGLNAVYGLGVKVNNLFTGEADAVAAINAEIEKTNRLLEQQAKSAAAVRPVMDANFSNIAGLQSQVAIEEAEGFDRQRQQVAAQIRQLQDAAIARYEKGVSSATHQSQIDALGKQADDQLSEIRRLNDIRFAAVDKAEREARDKQAAAEREAAARELEEQQRANEQIEREAARHQQRIAALESANRQARLIAAGDFAGAQAEQTRQATREALAGARDETERALILEQQSLKLAQIDAKANDGTKANDATRDTFGPRSVADGTLGRGFLGFASRFDEGRELRDTAQNTRRSADGIEGLRAEFAKLAQSLAGRRPQAAGGLLRVG
jgi:hypothetical protein